MTRTIVLLSPVFVSFFWAVTLTGNTKRLSTPRLFLSKFMILPFICFITHFLYFSGLKEAYYFFDFPYQYAGSLILPVYYIYFRLLTIDQKFSFKVHTRYLIIPFLLATLYCAGALLAPKAEYHTWLFNELAFPDSPYIRFLTIMRMLLRLQFLVLVVLTVIGNFRLIRKYGQRAEQFYSDLDDGKYNNANMLNYSILIICGASFVAVFVGRSLLMPKDYIIYIVWSIITVMLYIMGYMGFKQKPLNPAFDTEQPIEEHQLPDDTLSSAQSKILHKMILLFDEKKLYLNSQLNIMDIVNMVGTNRTYISSIINQQYNQNFCTFVNSYRIDELKRVLTENPESTNDMLADKCGFGSVISLKRAVSTRTGLSMPDFRNQLLHSKITV
ncbi:MAG: hypothetical protein PHT07_01975 [Paludibacter sp.]|nr:hypothetical protein [Paludibacter sp.]